MSLPARLFPGASAELIALYERARENAGLLDTDLYTIDDLVQLSGYVNDEPLHALLLALLLALGEGSLCVEASEDGLERHFAELAGPDQAREWSRRIVERLGDEAYAELMGQKVGDGKPVVLHTVEGTRYLYFQKYLKHEQELAALLSARLAAPPPSRDWKQLKTLIPEILAGPRSEDVRRLALNEDQRLAVVLGLARGFLVVSGGPGTGKTSIVSTLLRCLVRTGVAPERIGLAAPTGRAAQRMTDAVQHGLACVPRETLWDEDAGLKPLQARTLHQLLGYWPARGIFRHHRENPLPLDYVIVDEVSMVGIELMAQLCEATAQDTALILLGDKDQLPSVEAGALLAHLVPADRVPEYSAGMVKRLRGLLPGLSLVPASAPSALRDSVVVLSKNYRSQPEIQQLAQAVNLGQAEAALERMKPWRPRAQVASGSESSPEAPGPSFADPSISELAELGGCWLVEPGQKEFRAFHRLLALWAEHHFVTSAPSNLSYQELVVRAQDAIAGGSESAQETNLAALFACLNCNRVLTLLREGEWGCEGINKFFAERLRKRLDPRSRAPVFAGAPVLVTRNDHNRQLYNGDVGIVLPAPERGYRVWFQRSGRFESFAQESLPAHELAFALTVHKSQGSEYERVLLVFPPAGGRKLLTRELVYTGITRAKKLVVISCARGVLSESITRRTRRESALLRSFRSTTG
jgi:exodeoxyribonuclease V alpha subunit